MPTYLPHTRITLSGTLGPKAAPVEIFSCGFSVTGDATVADDFKNPLAIEGQGDTLLGNITTRWITDALGIRPMAVLREVKLAYVGPDGRYAKAPVVLDGMEWQGGSQGSDQVPPQLARAITLDTASFPKRSGRIFTPAPNYVLQADLRMSTAGAQSVADGWADLLGAVNRLDGDHRVVVVSGSSDGPRPRAAALLPVTQVRCGRVIDTMRSRRNALAEDHQAAAVADQ